MNCCWICLPLIGVAVLTGCRSSNGSGGESITQIILGSWETDICEGELGLAKSALTFEPDGKITMRSIFPDTSPPTEIANEGTYSISGDLLTSDEMNKGRPLRVWLDHGDLMMQIDQEVPVRFHRVRP